MAPALSAASTWQLVPPSTCLLPPAVSSPPSLSFRKPWPPPSSFLPPFPALRGKKRLQGSFARAKGGKKLLLARQTRAEEAYESSNGEGDGAMPGEDVEVDVAVVGAGIVGLSIAQRLLEGSGWRVALLDSARPCAGATGAGQGYIWMGHRSPSSPAWALALRGKALWEDLLAGCDVTEGPPPLGWKTTGSLLVAHTEEEAAALRLRSESLKVAGIEAVYLDATSARDAEPSLAVPDAGGALLVPGDSQLDAELAVKALLERCRRHGNSPNKRYWELFEEPVRSFIRCKSSGEVQGISTEKRTIRAAIGVVVAAGVWSTGFMAAALHDKESELPVVPRVKPRKGHLLVMEGLPQLSLNHALMESEYTNNYSSVQPLELNPSVSMTATTDANGRLLIGSSREFSGFAKNVDSETIFAMVERAAKFLPFLREGTVREAIKEGRIRTGLRPYGQG